MKKRVLSWIMLLLLCFTLFAGCQQTQTPVETPTDPPAAEEQSKVSPALYKVFDDRGNVAWLFGSIHVGTEDFYPLPEYVLSAFDGSDALAVEVDILALETDLQTQTDMMSMMVYTDGTTIKDHISPEVYYQAVAFLKACGAYMPVLDSYKPILWYSYLDSCATLMLGYDAELGVDYHMLKRAKDQGKKVLEVESAVEQYTLLADLSPELQAFLLENTVNSCSNLMAYRMALLMLVGAWEQGNTEALAANVNIKPMFMEEAYKLLYEEYSQILLTARDEGMTQYVVDALSSGEEVFICVGAAHVVGENGVVSQLRQLGYTVETVG